MEKFQIQNKVGVVVSGSYGSGFAAFAAPQHIFDRDLVMAVMSLNASDYTFDQLAHVDNKFLDMKDTELQSWIAEWTSARDLWVNPQNLVVEFVEVGTRFYIHEYDGLESIISDEFVAWRVA